MMTRLYYVAVFMLTFYHLHAQEPVSCPVYDVAPPPPGCKYEFVKDKDNCDVPKLTCSTKLPIVCKGPPFNDDPFCEVIEDGKDENGCPIYQMVCAAVQPAPECKPKPEITNPMCYLESNGLNDQGCPLWNEVCPSPRTTTTEEPDDTNIRYFGPLGGANNSDGEDCSQNPATCSEFETCRPSFSGGNKCLCIEGYARDLYTNSCNVMGKCLC